MLYYLRKGCDTLEKNEINKKFVGSQIKNIRLKNGWTIVEFASELEKILSDNKTISSGIISRWENGLTLPSPERLKAISKLGNLTVDELLHGSLKEHISRLLIALEVRLEFDKSIPNELHESILNNMKNRYFDSDGNLIDDWFYYDSIDDLAQSFVYYSNKFIDMAKKGTLKEETNLSSFITNIENAFSDFLDYYILSSINENSETSNTSKDVFNLELKDKVSKITMEYLDKLNDIEYYKIHDEMNNNQ